MHVECRLLHWKVHIVDWLGHWHIVRTAQNENCPIYLNMTIMLKTRACSLHIHIHRLNRLQTWQNGHIIVFSILHMLSLVHWCMCDPGSPSFSSILAVKQLHYATVVKPLCTKYVYIFFNKNSVVYLVHHRCNNVPAQSPKCVAQTPTVNEIEKKYYRSNNNNTDP